MDLLSYALESTVTNTFWLKLVNMFSFLGYDFELIVFSYYIWTMVAEKKEITRAFIRYISIVCIADILFVVFGTFTGMLFNIENGEYGHIGSVSGGRLLVRY